MTRRTLAPGDDIAAVARSAPAREALTLVVDPGRDPLALARTLASLAPLAIERAPARLNAVLPAVGAEPADVDAAVAWLERAESTTGQLVEVSASPPPPASARTAPGRR